MKKNTLIAILTSAAILFGSVQASQAASSDCQPFAKGQVISAQRTAWGQDVIIAIKKHGRKIRLIDADTCELLDSIKVSRNTSTHKLVVNNLWQAGGGDSGSPEIVFTERVNKRHLSLRFYTVTEGMTLQKISSKTLSVAKGAVSLSASDKSLTVNGTPWHLILWNNEITLKKTDKSLLFLALGDEGEWGEGKDAVAAAMNGVAETNNGAEFITTLGDNFYPTDTFYYTIQSVDDSDWEDNFQIPYSLDYLEVPFYIGLGNHDYSDNDLDSILAYDDPTGKWNLPDNYYTVTYPESSSSPLLEVIMLDTEMIESEYDGAAAQISWLEETLAASTATWKIVAGHHPAYSYGQHGDTASIQADVLPLLTEYGVDIYLTGHEHDKQVIDRSDDDILHVVSGAGSRLRDTSEGADTLFSASTLGFTGIQIVGDTLELSMYDTDQLVEYSTELTK